MPLRSGGSAPYAPPAAVLSFIDSFRNKALPSPITAEVVVRAGVNESLVPRTLKSLEALALIDDKGKPTPALEGLRRASQSDFTARLEEVVREAYAEVLQYVDPAKDDPSRISDQFRHFEPIGQLGRMVTLFLGLCKAAGIIPESSPRKAAPAASARGTSTARTKRSRTAPSSTSSGTSSITFAPAMPGGIPPALQGLVANLPSADTGWTQSQRDRWIAAVTATLDFAIPVRTAEEIANSSAPTDYTEQR